MRRAMLASLLVLIAMQLHATPETSVVSSATMNVESARYGFEGIEQVALTLISIDGVAPSGMILEYGENKVQLEINATETDHCGCIQYSASLPSQEFNGPRFNVYLTDHTAQSCSHDVGNTWKASVRSGYGWCGTMDSTMELSGLPVVGCN